MDTNEPINLTAHYTGKLRVRVCGILLQDKKILLVRHQGIAGEYNLWSPPGGGLTYGEKIMDCLAREFREETGLEVKPLRYLFLHEYLKEPLHALELFFEVGVIGGGLKMGSDPEMGADNQLIREVAFKTLAEIRSDTTATPHQIFEDLIDLDDLFMPQNRFLK